MPPLDKQKNKESGAMKFQKLLNSGESETTDKGEQQPELQLELRLESLFKLSINSRPLSRIRAYPKSQNTR